MRENVRSSIETNSIVEQTTDLFNRVRNSLVRNRQERLLDEDIQAIENILNQLYFSELISKETLTKLISQDDSIRRSFHLINQLDKEIKQIADDLHEVNGQKCSTFNCFSWIFQRKKIKRKNFQQKISTNKIQNNFSIEREEIIEKTRALTHQRRQNPKFQQIFNDLQTTKQLEMKNNEKKFLKFRDYLIENHSLSYGYIDQPNNFINEITMAIHFTQLNTHLDHLLQITDLISHQINQQNIFISKIETQAMESGNLLTDYTLLGHNILGSSNTQLPTNLALSTLNSVI